MQLKLGLEYTDPPKEEKNEPLLLKNKSKRPNLKDMPFGKINSNLGNLPLFLAINGDELKILSKPPITQMEKGEDPAFNRCREIVFGFVEHYKKGDYFTEHPLLLLHSVCEGIRPVYPLEIGLYAHTIVEFNDRDNYKLHMDRTSYLLTVYRAMRDDITSNLIIKLKNDSRKYRLDLSDFSKDYFPVINEFLEDLSLPFYSRLQFMFSDNIGEQNEAIRTIRRIKICKGCYKLFSEFIPFDNLCSRKIGSDLCRKIYIRDFVNYTSNKKIKLVEKLLMSIIEGDSLKLDENIEKINQSKKYLLSISNDIYEKLMKIKDFYKNEKGFDPRLHPGESIKLLPPNKDSKYYKEVSDIEKGNKSLKKLVKNRDISPYEKNRILRWGALVARR